MNNPSRIVAGLLLACAFATSSSLTLAQDAAGAKPVKPAVGTPVAPAEVYGKLLSLMEKEFVSAAEAMPEDKFDFAPSAGEFKGVRSFGAQVKHVAEDNYYFYRGSMSEADIKSKGDAIEKLKAKAEITQALKDSFVQAHSVVDGITADNAFVMTEHSTRGGMAAFGLAHIMDHYGQMAVYLRMNGIVPPASRGN
jgi:uncharacterized damage-inducible protein DinB